MKKAISITILLIMVISAAALTAAATFEDRSDDRVHDERFFDSLVVDGVDVSIYQGGNSDWNAAKASGIDFAIMRVTLTRNVSGTMETDSVFEEHYNNAKDAGIMCGVYAFSQAKDAEEGAKEAEFAVARLQELGIGPEDLMLPVYMDYEFLNKGASRLSDLTSENAIAAAQAFCETVQSYGYDAGIYANSSFFTEYLNEGRDFSDDIDLWIAQYSSSISSECRYSKWQYSSSAKVPDIYVNSESDVLDDVDINYWYIDREIGDSPISISGNTNLEYTGGPVLPELAVHDGEELLEEGTDYIVGGIRNIDAGDGAYAYIKGIGEYEGYALVPVNIEDDQFDSINLPSKVIKGTNYEKTGYRIYSDSDRTCIGTVPEGLTSKELLDDIELSNEDYHMGMINSHGERMDDDSIVDFNDMIGIYNEDDTLIGTIDIETETEKGINNIRHK
ncbi:MAG: hypothetical protein IJH95_07795 [Mogibacterium sp.]|nr:hypothetical protein [Mogibacterium sp.]